MEGEIERVTAPQEGQGRRYTHIVLCTRMMNIDKSSNQPALIAREVAMVLVALMLMMMMIWQTAAQEQADVANISSVELDVCADCWSKDALGPVKEGEGGIPQVTCEAVLAQAYWADLKLTDQLMHPERLCLAVEFPAEQPVGSLKCEIEKEGVLGRMGKAASVAITYDYDPAKPQEAPKVTLEGKVCLSSLRDLPSAVRQGMSAAMGPLRKEAQTVAHEAHHLGQAVANTAQRVEHGVTNVAKEGGSTVAHGVEGAANTLKHGAARIFKNPFHHA